MTSQPLRLSGGARVEPSVSVRERGIPRWLQAMLRVPLAAKLAGANALIVVAAAAMALPVHGTGAHERQMVVLMCGALVASLVVSSTLVFIALRPLRDLEQTARRVGQGNLEARVTPSPIADRDMARVGSTLNKLLDDLVSDRARVRQLAAEVIRAGDEERARIARELHDSTAQMLAALTLQTTAALRDNTDPALATHLRAIHDLAVDSLEEVRLLSHTIHPRVLDDLGLPAALGWVARQTRELHGVEVTVQSHGDGAALPRPVGSALYRVAQEALTNAVRHAAPRSVRIILTTGQGAARLEIRDDGRGFDVEEAKARRPGMGLFTMQERVALTDGRLVITSLPGRGTIIVATVPLRIPR